MADRTATREGFPIDQPLLPAQMTEQQPYKAPARYAGSFLDIGGLYG